jgi:ABC-type glycerol-3-phosphate transport system substrate-binding protein
VMPSGVNSYQEKESQETFLNENAVFMRNWNSVWALAENEESPVKGKVGVVPLPQGENGKNVASLGGWNLAISKHSKYPNEAFEFIKWMTDAKQQKVKAIEGGRLPTDASLYEDEEVIAKNPSFKEFYGVLTNGVSRPISPQYGKVSEAIQMEISAAFNGQKPVEKALEDLQKQLESLSE